MPELPEVETNKTILLSLIKNKTIVNIDIFYSNLIKSDLNEFKKNILNKKILDISRIGKYLLFYLSNNFILLTHLRMEGKFILNKIRTSATSLIFYFNDSNFLTFDDTRKFAVMKLIKKEDLYRLKEINELGIEANKIKEKDYPNLINKLRKNKPIKSLITDQKILAGIGNIYADEILFKSKINPFTKGKDLNNEEFIKIFKNSNLILNEAIKYSGSSVHTFNVNGNKGNYQEKLLCYGKENTACPNCGTFFHKEFLSKRGTTFCPNCQIYLPLKKAIGITGPIGSGKSTLLNYFKSKGYKTFSSDILIKEIYKKDDINYKISKLFKKKINIDNKLDREFIKSKIIQNNILKITLEKILYKELEKELINIVSTYNDVVIEVPLLFYAHLEYLFKKIYVIRINKDKQKKNLSLRGENYLKSIELNKNYFVNLENKDIKYIVNNGSKLDLYNQIDE